MHDSKMFHTHSTIIIEHLTSLSVSKNGKRKEKKRQSTKNLWKNKTHNHQYSQYLDLIGYGLHLKLNFHKSSTSHCNLASEWICMIWH